MKKIKELLSKSGKQYHVEEYSQRNIVRLNQQHKKTKQELKRENITDYTQDYCPFEEIKDGIFIMKDGRVVKIMEVLPINFNLKTKAEKDVIIYDYVSLLSLPDLDTCQLKCVVKRANDRKYLEMLRISERNETIPEIKFLLRDYIRKVEQLGGTEALLRRYFFIFDVHASRGIGSSKLPLDRAISELQIKSKQIEEKFKSIGNPVITYRSTSEETRSQHELIYEILNPKSSVAEPFKQRYEKIVKDTMLRDKKIPNIHETPYIKAVDLVAPRGLDFSHEHYLISDGLYYRFLYLKAKKGYPNVVSAAFSSRITNYLADGCAFDIHIKRAERNNSTSDVRRKNAGDEAELRQSHINASNYAEKYSRYEASSFIREAITKGGEDLFYISSIITVTGRTFEEADNRVKYIKNEFNSSYGMELFEPRFKIQQTYQSVLPFNYLSKDLKRATERNITTFSLAAFSYFFTAFTLSDTEGVVLGLNRSNNSLVVLNPFNRSVYDNANMVILGGSGSGKTFTALTYLITQRILGKEVMVIAPLKAHEFMRSTKAIKGEFLTISPDSNTFINIMDIRPKPETMIDDFDGMEFKNTSLLTEKIGLLLTFFGLIDNKVNEDSRLKSMLDLAIVKTYQKFGITRDNQSLYLNPNDPTVFKPMPILGDIYDVVLNDPEFRNEEKPDFLSEEAKDIKLILQRFIDGSMQSFNKHTNIKIDNQYVVFDISRLPEDMLPMGMLIATDLCWDRIKADRTKDKILFMDEVWLLIKSSPETAKFVLEIFKIIRAYGGSAIAATQDLLDFTAKSNEEFGKGIISNSKIKLILKIDDEKPAIEVQEFMGLTDNERVEYQSRQRGEGLLIANNTRIPISIHATELQTQMITTDPQLLKEILADKNSAFRIFQENSEKERAKQLRIASQNIKNTR